MEKINTEERYEKLREYIDSVKDSNVLGFMKQCIETIPNYWFMVPASSSGKYHPNYALGNGGLLRHTIALLRFFNRLMINDMYGHAFTEHDMDLVRVACLMHDSRKSGSEEDFEKCKYTRFDHPLLAAETVRSINTDYINDNDKEIIASAIESHMGQWNTDSSGRCKVVLPLPVTKYQKIVHTVDYLSAMKGCEISFDGFVPDNNRPMEFDNKNATVDTYVFPFGKYRGMKLTEVNEKYPDYISWAKRNIENKQLKELLEQI